MRKFALDIGDQSARGLFRRREWRRRAEEGRIDREQTPRLLVGRAAHHHAVKLFHFRERLLDAADPAVEYNWPVRMRGFEMMHQRVVERRYLAVLLRREALQPRLARMHDQRIGPCPLHLSGEP